MLAPAGEGDNRARSGTGSRSPAIGEDGTVDVSIIVCTRNRASQLRRCLASLAAAQVPPAVWAEVVVVDNGSGDDTPLVVEDARVRLALPVRFTSETRRGSGFARNRGLEVARGRIIAFIDDDCVVAPEWLSHLWQEFEGDPDAGIIGGRVELSDPRDRRVTIKPTKHRQRLEQIRQLDGFIHGCNTAYRRAVIADVGAYDPRFGAGAAIPAGEDTDLLWRAFRAGWKIAYSPTFVVYHAHGRRTAAEEERLRRSYRIGTGALRMKHILRGDADMARWAGQEVLRHLREALAQWRAPAASALRLRQLGHLLSGAARYVVSSRTPG